jgi:repressor LexA
VIHCPQCGHTYQPRQQPLTAIQHAVFDFVRDYIGLYGFAPSNEEIAEARGYKSLATVHEHLTNIERKGWITRVYNEARGISLVDVSPIATEAQR